MTFDPVVALCGGALVFAAFLAWWVLRPFERHRRELKRAREHAAE